MTDLRAVQAAPAGPQVGAFFDFDGTIIDGFSAFSYLADRAARGDLPLEETFALGSGMMEARRGSIDFNTFMRRSCHSFRGTDTQTLHELGVRLYETRLAKNVYPGALALVRAHQARGHTVVIASSALPFQLEAAARDLGIHHLLCTRLELADGVCTGRIEGRIVWDAGKAAAVTEFAAGRELDLAASFAYGNGDEDIAFLSTVGHPSPVNPAPELAKFAQDSGWPVHQLTLATPPPGRAARIARLARGLVRETAKTLAP